jgi:hypothetical protein
MDARRNSIVQIPQKRARGLMSRVFSDFRRWQDLSS